jgi:glycosyltransferase involved in cell wall biosynthesis
MTGMSDIRTLTLVAFGSGLPPEDELIRQELADERPRASTFRRRLNTDTLDERFLVSGPAYRSFAYSAMPPPLPQVLEAFRIRNRYDAIISWTEQLGISMAGLLSLTSSRPAHIGLFSWISKPKKARLLKVLHPHLDRIVLWSSVQRDFAVRRIGIPSEKIVLTRHSVDEKFWRPIPEVPPDMICAAGREMRDYRTLVEALGDLPIPCHIAAKRYPGKRDDWFDTLRQSHTFPAHLTMGPKSPRELRTLYNRARFVVIPVLPTDTDNGVTCMLEAMASGRTVICSRVHGQRDVLQDGKTGLFVSPGDPRALREAIEFLWNNPERAEVMGKEARAYVERYHGLDGWITGIRNVVEDAISERERRRGRKQLPLSVALKGA